MCITFRHPIYMWVYACWKYTFSEANFTKIYVCSEILGTFCRNRVCHYVGIRARVRCTSCEYHRSSELQPTRIIIWDIHRILMRPQTCHSSLWVQILGCRDIAGVRETHAVYYVYWARSRGGVWCLHTYSTWPIYAHMLVNAILHVINGMRTYT